jgi:signal transduction histidine kinase
MLAQLSFLRVDSLLEEHDLIPYCSFFKDSTESLTLDEIKHKYQDKFVSEIDFSINKNTSYWVRFYIKNTNLQALNAYYLFVNQAKENVFYQSHLTLKNGENIPFNQAAYPYRFNFFPIFLNFDSVQVGYLKIAPTLQESPQIKLILKKKVDAQQPWEANERYLIMGIFIAMTLYNLFLFFVIRDKSYLYYVIYIASLTIWLNNIIVFGNTPVSYSLLASVLSVFEVVVFCNGYVGFMRYFFEMPAHFPQWNRYFKSIHIAFVVPALIAVVEWVMRYSQPVAISIDSQLANLIALLAVSSSLVFGIYAFLKKHHLAIYFIIASSPLLLSGIVLGIEFFLGKLNYNSFGATALRYGTAIEAMLMAFALAYRYNLLKKEIGEKEKANELLEREKIIEIQKVTEQKNEELSQKVKERTQELQSLNTTKDKLFSIIGHDLRSPLNALKSLLHLLHEKMLSQEELQIISKKLQYNVDSLHDTLENLLQWSLSQMQGIQTKVEEIDLQQTINEKLALYQETALNKQIAIQNLVQKPTWVRADKHQLALVLRNLINNAIKFSFFGRGTVVIESTEDDNFVFVHIRDNGMGMTSEQVKKLFNQNTSFSSAGTQGEKGTGLGLLLCKEFVEKNGGQVWVKSVLGKGSTFIFSVPKFDAKK